jgi:CheY-like chemotaxis protein
MPEMSGSALIRELRGVRGSLPVVLMSGYLGPMAGARDAGVVRSPAADEAVATGADAVLQKPLSARDLATSLARVLRS